MVKLRQLQGIKLFGSGAPLQQKLRETTRFLRKLLHFCVPTFATCSQTRLPVFLTKRRSSLALVSMCRAFKRREPGVMLVPG